MKKSQISPSGLERVLKEQDFIVSKTDLKGRITYGNRAFADYAGYTEAEFLGQAHNLVRHPDMPRAVFKLLWDRISQHQEVFAYVKNMAKDGSHYWVIANVTPSYDVAGELVGYFSVRRRPNAKALPAVTALYKKMRELEDVPDSREGMRLSAEYLAAQLAENNTDYDRFVLALEAL
jgi:PAS domain S-box-containing protein